MSLGCAGADIFCQALGLPAILGPTSFVRYTEELDQLSTQAVEDSFNVASANIHGHLGVARIRLSIQCSPVKVPGASRVTQLVMLPVISQETRQVVDCSFLSKSCPECIKHQNFGMDSEELRYTMVCY